MNRNKTLVQFFDAGDKNNALRAHQIADSFGLSYCILGGGDEYELVDKIKGTQSVFVIPLNFPKAFDVEDKFNAQYLSLADMRHWNQAPANPAVLSKNEIEFALTLHGLDKFEDFRKNLMKAISYGLSEDKALEALTTTPAKILKKSGQIGSLRPGSMANFFICDGNYFSKDSRILEHWVQGEPLRMQSLSSPDFSGNYKLKIGPESYELSISDSKTAPKSTVTQNGRKVKSKLSVKDDELNLFLEADSTTNTYLRLYGKKSKGTDLAGQVSYLTGSQGTWTAVRTESKGSQKPKDKEEGPYTVSPVTFPNVAFGFDEIPEAEDILFKGVTVWTNEEEGILTETDVLVKDGKISKIGKGLKAGKARTIDGKGKHLTSGIIDEHSHIATVATNESGQNSTAEVTMEDAINHEDINIYRNLAGGVTEAQILHGSANPIGGRSAIIKLKWGKTPDEMIDQNAPGFIKFALGENVKQSNWSSYSRFPQTRMGVEQVYVDYFQRAREYDRDKKAGKELRKDLELEVLAEILNEERFISCHSYVQSEINMLMKVAEQFDFRINTFTHILEGYKLADKMSAHGAGGSTFSDWWAYKYEVNDAIPYNAAIMHSQGVITAINSDDAEMSRRLNQEAAKTIKYGGVSEEDAWKFVTLNPAKLLHIDDRVGSIKVGKDADLVLWSDHPLSVKAKAEKTLIEGVVYFDLERDREMREAVQKEKNELINQMLNEKISGKSTVRIKTKSTRLNHCDTVD
jgi:imidazolonepropionase-like amidohydrolase